MLRVRSNLQYVGATIGCPSTSLPEGASKANPRDQIDLGDFLTIIKDQEVASSLRQTLLV